MIDKNYIVINYALNMSISGGSTGGGLDSQTIPDTRYASGTLLSVLGAEAYGEIDCAGYGTVMLQLGTHSYEDNVATPATIVWQGSVDPAGNWQLMYGLDPSLLDGQPYTFANLEGLFVLPAAGLSKIRIKGTPSTPLTWAMRAVKQVTVVQGILSTTFVSGSVAVTGQPINVVTV